MGWVIGSRTVGAKATRDPKFTPQTQWRRADGGWSPDKADAEKFTSKGAARLRMIVLSSKLGLDELFIEEG